MLKSENIFLRELDIGDLDFILSIENDSNNWLVSNTSSVYTKKEIEDYILSINDLKSDKQFRWVICKNEDENVIGAIDLFEYDPLHKRAGLGLIISESFRRQGYAIESIKLISDYAFSHLHLTQLWANILENNNQSIRLFEKCKFSKTGVKKKWILHEKQFIDMYFYQLMNKEKIS